MIIAGAENQQGPYNTSDPDYMNINIEGDLDAELALSVAWPTPLTVYNTGGCVLLFCVRFVVTLSTLSHCCVVSSPF